MVKRIFGVVVCLCLSIPAYAQTLGTITGEVKDASGATIPGATVTAQNVATNALRTQQSNEVGAFAFPAMPPGEYLVFRASARPAGDVQPLSGTPLSWPPEGPAPFAVTLR